ncbi:MAG: CoA-binding protein [Flavobacteriaceae bacterium]|nr:CoA-binding protein [Flavobacteriaceae bacterium]
MSKKVTLVLGASNKPGRYSKMALELLEKKGKKTIAIGLVEASVGNIKIHQKLPEDVKTVHTVSLYIRASLQEQYQDLIFQLNPKRVIFNPGTSNLKLQEKLREVGIEVLSACTLVMLQTNQY